MVLSNILFRQSEPFSSNLFSSRRSRPLGSRLMNISVSTCNKDAPAAKLYPYCGIVAPDIGGGMHADKRHCQAGAWRYHPVPLQTSVIRRQVTRRQVTRRQSPGVCLLLSAAALVSSVPGERPRCLARNSRSASSAFAFIRSTAEPASFLTHAPLTSIISTSSIKG